MYAVDGSSYFDRDHVWSVGYDLAGILHPTECADAARGAVVQVRAGHGAGGWLTWDTGTDMVRAGRRRPGHTAPRPGERPALHGGHRQRHALASDKSGQRAADLLIEAGHVVHSREIVVDDRAAIAELVRAAVANPAIDAVVLTGGTGIAPRDVTYEAIEGLLDKPLHGFGELFSNLSYGEIGARRCCRAHRRCGRAHGGVRAAGLDQGRSSSASAN